MTIASISAWALDHARTTETEVALIESLTRQLAAVRLVRVSTSFRPIDPVLWARNVTWERDQGMSVRDRLYDQNLDYFEGSAPQAIFAGQPGFRERLEHGSRFPPIDGLVRQHATDYVIQALDLGRVRTYLSYATDRVGGFTEDELALLAAIQPAVCSVIRERSIRLTTAGLLRTYLGPNAATRVLSGTVRRGHGERVSAAIWFCDLRGFTVLSQELAPDEVLRILDDYFEAVADPVADHGGEILKFIGDAMLAIFPAPPDQLADACTRATNAAIAAFERFATHVDATHRTVAGRELGMGLALHVGDVFYGNIGARGRLDFTVIGPEVNLAARVQGQCNALATPLLMTAAFADLTGRDDLRRLGTAQLKGIAEPPELVTLARFVR